MPDTLYIAPVMTQTAETPTISLSATGAQLRNQMERGGTGRHAIRAPKLPRRKLKYKQSLWTLYKSSADPYAKWFLSNGRGGAERRRVSLGFAGYDDAVVIAKQKIDAWRAGILDPAKPAAPVCSTLGDLFAVVDRLAMAADAKSRHTYVWGARHFFDFALGTGTNATTGTDGVQTLDAVSLALVNGETGAEFWSRVAAHGLTLPTQPNQNKFRSQAHGWWTNCHALFTADAVRSAEKLGLVFPDAASLAAFRASKPQSFKLAKTPFVAPSNAILRETFRQWIALGRTPGYAVLGGSGNSRRRDELQPLHETARRNMFIAIGLMLSCGLRKGEVMQIRWRHLARVADGTPRLIARDIRVKKGDGVCEVKPLEPFWRILNRTIARNGWAGGDAGAPRPDDLVLAQRPQTAGAHRGLQFRTGGHCDRTYWPFFHIGKWLRSLGWDLQKTNHALRDCAGSLVTMRFSLDRAKKFCRHGSRQTTEDHYSRFVREDLMDNPKGLAWLRWAR